MQNRRLPADLNGAVPAHSPYFEIAALLRALKTTPEEIEQTLSRKSRTSRLSSKRRHVARH